MFANSLSSSGELSEAISTFCRSHFRSFILWPLSARNLRSIVLHLHANIPDCLFSAFRYALARLSHRCSSVRLR